MLVPEVAASKIIDDETRAVYREYVDDYYSITDDRTFALYCSLSPKLNSFLARANENSTWTVFGPGQCVQIDGYFQSNDFPWKAQVQALGKTGFHSIPGRFSHFDVYDRLRTQEKNGKFRPQFGVYLETHMPPLDGTTDFGSDIFAPFTYAKALDLVLFHEVSYLKVGGVVDIVTRNADLFGAGVEEGCAPWLAKSTGIKWNQNIFVGDPTGRGGKFSLFNLTIERTNEDFAIPRLRSNKFSRDPKHCTPLRSYTVLTEYLRPAIQRE